MSRDTVHILNGDALADRFPAAIPGEKISFRECLISGNVDGETMEDFYQTRAAFIHQNYTPDSPQTAYYQYTVPQLEKIRHLPPACEVNLWFEEDLFCQVNCWFVAHLLYRNKHQGDIFLIRPHTNLEEGFGGLDEKGLIEVMKKSMAVPQKVLSLLSQLWEAYKYKNEDKLYKIANELCEKLPFLPSVIEAELARNGKNGQMGRPEASLQAIMNELGPTGFGPAFRAFSKRESIYGFGDLQVLQMWKKLKGDQS